MRSIHKVLCAALLLAAFAGSAHAQTVYFNGQVQLPSGQAVPSALITVCALGAQGIPCAPVVAITTSDANGNYSLSLTAGDYVICTTGALAGRCQNQTVGGGTGATVTIQHGTQALGTSAIPSHTCATTVTVSATGVATTDNILADFNADPTSTTGYEPGAMLTIVKFPTANNVNFTVCNNTGDSITPGAVTLNWRVLR